MKKMAYLLGVCGQISVWKVEESGKLRIVSVVSGQWKTKAEGGTMIGLARHLDLPALQFHQ